MLLSASPVDSESSDLLVTPSMPSPSDEGERSEANAGESSASVDASSRLRSRVSK